MCIKLKNIRKIPTRIVTLSLSTHHLCFWKGSCCLFSVKGHLNESQETSFFVFKNISAGVFTRASPPRWNPPWHGEGAYLTKRFQPSATTRRATRSDAATFDQNKQIFLSTLPRTEFNTKVCSYLNLS